MFLRKSTLGAIASALLASSALAQTQPYFRSVAPSFVPATPPGNPNNPDNPTDPETTAPLEVSISSAPGEGMAGVAIPAFGYAIAGGKGPYTVTLPGSPDLSASDGVVSGTPLVPGLYRYAVRVVDAEGTIIAAEAPELLIHHAFAVDTSGPSIARVGESATISISSNGGKAPVVYGIEGGVPGMEFDGTALKGYPSTIGSYNFTLWAQDSFLGQRVERNRSLSVNANPYQLSILGNTRLNLRPGQELAPNLTTNVPNPRFSVVGAPSYVSAHQAGLIVVRAPEVTEPTTIPNFRIRAENAQNPAQYREIEVSDLGIIRPALTASLANATGRGNVRLTAALTLGGFESPGAAVVETGSLPTSMTANSSGVSGRPSQEGSFPVRLRVTDQADGASVLTETATITVTPSLDFAVPGNEVAGFVGTAVSKQLTTRNALGTIEYAAVDNHLQAIGLGISTSGLISGTPTAASIQEPLIRMTENLNGQITTIEKKVKLSIDVAAQEVTRPTSVTGYPTYWQSGLTRYDTLDSTNAFHLLNNTSQGSYYYSNGGYQYGEQLRFTWGADQPVSCMQISTNGSIGAVTLSVTGYAGDGSYAWGSSGGNGTIVSFTPVSGKQTRSIAVSRNGYNNWLYIYTAKFGRWNGATCIFPS